MKTNIEFVGSCHKVVLTNRGKTDNHILVQVYTEDDGNWNLGIDMFSSFWLLELSELMDSAAKWLEDNAEPVYLKHGTQCGWKFKDEEESDGH